MGHARRAERAKLLWDPAWKGHSILSLFPTCRWETTRPEKEYVDAGHLLSAYKEGFAGEEMGLG